MDHFSQESLVYGFFYSKEVIRCRWGSLTSQSYINFKTFFYYISSFSIVHGVMRPSSRDQIPSWDNSFPSFDLRCSKLSLIEFARSIKLVLHDCVSANVQTYSLETVFCMFCGFVFTNKFDKFARIIYVTTQPIIDFKNEQKRIQRTFLFQISYLAFSLSSF